MKASEPSLSAPGQRVAEILQSLVNTGDIEVPLLPEVASKVVTLSQDRDSDASQLSQLIQSDQSLAGHVMRIANSAAYSPNATLVSLQQAITRLGMTLIGDIAMAASINTKMFHTPGFETHVDAIWRHALATALWSKEVARACRRNVEATFLCGLLHSIGRPVVLHTAIEIGQRQATPLSTDDAVLLEERYQRRVGTTVAEKWEMPKTVCETIRHFDDYQSAPGAAEQTAMVSAGAQLAWYMLTPEDLPLSQMLEHPAFADVNLYPDQVEALLEKRDAIVSTMETMAP
ncbi:HDOD domain-containing protein [Exilibacterium tricleocarpae]|uniref:HDOD domain-containing protein n=1 Tax=Exilibacterium tricleocarpae TaxID=2591008 RepID=A0A545TSD9_9GAMM|nr:HDOD domain-containing protein [Exilibacterium tricleocarpae]TQV80132.1 HDOD domain-containing protein [Exilibacterium tricleocarpae]